VTDLSATHADRSLGSLIAALPAILHFTPAESLIMVGLTGEHPWRVQYALRVDLPQPSDYSALLDQLRICIDNQRFDAVAVIIVGGQEPNSDHRDLPHRQLVDGCIDMALQLGLAVMPPVWVPAIEAGQRWISYVELGQMGAVPDPGTSPATAAMAFLAGDVTYADRNEFEAQLKGDPAADLSRRAELLRSQPPVAVADAIEIVHQAVDRMKDVTARLDDDTIVSLAHALTHPRVRDAALAIALTDLAQPAEILWTHLARATPRSHVTHPATLLAFAAYLRGNGALAGLALDVAIDADQPSELAGLLRIALHNSTTPCQLKDLLTEAANCGSHRRST
jgi:hypothetical protein